MPGHFGVERSVTLPRFGAGLSVCSKWKDHCGGQKSSEENERAIDRLHAEEKHHSKCTTGIGELRSPHEHIAGKRDPGLHLKLFVIGVSLATKN